MQFVLRREYSSLDNEDFVRLCDTYRFLLLLIMVGMLILAVAIMANGIEKAASR